MLMVNQYGPTKNGLSTLKKSLSAASQLSIVFEIEANLLIKNSEKKTCDTLKQEQLANHTHTPSNCQKVRLKG